MAENQGNVKEKSRSGVDEPRQFEVIIHNDDFTPMEVVVIILMKFFYKTQGEAYRLMMKVHNSEKAAVGVYTYDIAVSKVYKATNFAREQGYPLKLEIKPLD